MKKRLLVICKVLFLSLVITALYQVPSANTELSASVVPVLLAQTEQPEALEAAPPVIEEQPAPEAKPAETIQPEAPQGTPAVSKKRKVVREAPQPSESTVSFFFDDADVFEVVQTVFGDILKANYIIDPRVKGKVNFRTINPIPREEVLPIMEIILRINGVGFVEEKGLYNIIPLTDTPKELAFAQVGKEPGQVAIELFTFKNLNIKDAMPDIESAIALGVDSGKIKVIPAYRLNALMVMASTKEQLDYIREWVERFDTMFAYAKPKIMVYPLQNSKAKDVASMLQSILGGGGGSPAPSSTPAPAPTAQRTTPAAGATPAPTAPQAPRSGPTTTVTGTGFLVSSETKIFADEINNSLVILATPSDYAFIEETIRKIDIAPRQVIIEGLIVQVTLTDNLSFGLSYSVNTDINISGIKPFTRSVNLGENLNNAPSLSLNAGGLDKTKLPGTGFTFVGTDPTGNIRAVLNALQDRSKAKVVAAPQILVSDNREARIQVGQEIPIATSTSSQVSATTSTTTTGQTVVNPVVGTSTIQYKDIGIILKVKPQINDSGLIALELSQEISSIGSSVDVGGLAEISINKTEATSNLVARDGETIIIGGLIREDTTHETSGIPWLSKIPIIGALFGNTSDLTTRSELIILLTPHVMRNQQEAEGTTSDYVERFKSTTKDKEIDRFIKERGKKEKSGDGAGAKDAK